METATPAALSGHMLRSSFEAQRAAFRRNPPDYRARIEALRSLERALLNHKDDLIQAISEDFSGRAAEETIALELVPTLNEIRHAARNLKSWMELRFGSEVCT